MFSTRIFSAACAFAITISTTQAAEQVAEDATVVKACLDVAVARKEAAAKAEEAADDAKRNTGPEAYLDAAARLAAHAPENCIGVVAGPCMETEEGGSTYGMLACIGRETDVWDARLNAAYREASAPQTDSGLDAAASEIVTQQPRKIQRAWIAWRDATCEVLHSDGIPIYGSLAKVDGAYCYMTLTARQALWLEGKSILGVEN